MHELKPCPFCGSNDVSMHTACIQDLVWKHVVRCKGCSATIERYTISSRPTAIEAWNRRVGEASEDGSGFAMFND